MWMLRDTPALLTDHYELTMAQVYFLQAIRETGCFEVFVRHLPEHWGYFVMAGLPKVQSYLHELRFAADDIDYLRSVGSFRDEFLEYLSHLRLDSGDLVALSRFAYAQFRQEGLDFLQIFASGDLDEFRIAKLLDAGAPIDGFGVGTRFIVSQHVPALGIVYKIAQYGARPLHKTSPEKETRPGRKSLVRTGTERYELDTVGPFQPAADDLLQPFPAAEPMPAIQQRLARERARLPDSVKALRNPLPYPVPYL
ncbi:MAG: hypothetical protein MUC88_19010 [Planctomycetes bacterium]|jgi:nicotinic acid phosphoribosyltransferase|nr:hypothetical protein [Planctomycetota bacterium]